MKLEELKLDQENDTDSLHEMANVGPRRHGIENVYIFVGSIEKAPHWLRVKVSNVPGKYDKNNNFSIKMPNLDYDPKQVATWITPKMMKEIIEWIKLNQQVLYDYETGKLTDTDDFLDNLSKIK